MTITKEQIEQLIKIKNALAEAKELLGSDELATENCRPDLDNALDSINDLIDDTDEAISNLIDSNGK